MPFVSNRSSANHHQTSPVIHNLCLWPTNIDQHQPTDLFTHISPVSGHLIFVCISTPPNFEVPPILPVQFRPFSPIQLWSGPFLLLFHVLLLNIRGSVLCSGVIWSNYPILILLLGCAPVFSPLHLIQLVLRPLLFGVCFVTFFGAVMV